MDSEKPLNSTPSMTDARKRVLVIGGGISGLTFAHVAKKQGARVTLLESRDRCGGAIETCNENGYLSELGPNTIQVTQRSVEDFMSEIGLGSERVEPDPCAQNRFVVRDGNPVPVPSSILSGATTRLFGLRGKLRLLADVFVKKRTETTDESLADFVRRRIGAEFLNYAINPMVGGIYAGDPERLSVQYAFPKIYQLEKEFGGMLKGAWGSRHRRKNDSNTIPAKIVSFGGGMERLPLKIEHSLGEAVQKGVQIQSVERRGNSWRVSWHTAQEKTGPTSAEFDLVVVTIPAHRIAATSWAIDLLGNTSVFKKVEYPPVASVSLGFAREQIRHRLDGFGVLIPEVEKRSILGTLFPSSMFANRAPHGKIQLTSFVGGARQPEYALAPESQLVERVIRDNSDLLGITGTPEYSKVTVWNRAIPQYNVGHGDILNEIYKLQERYPGLLFCGNYLEGISLEKCIVSARFLAELHTTE